MMSDPLKLIVKGMMANAELSDWEIGEVVSVSPVMIKLSDVDEPLNEDFLMLPERLTRETYEVEITTKEPVILGQYSLTHTVNHPTHGSESLSHNSDATANIQFTDAMTLKFVDITLKVGDKVILFKATGGQKYYVLDRVG